MTSQIPVPFTHLRNSHIRSRSITDEEFWDWPIAWECLDDLLGRPFRGRTGSDIEVDDATAIVREDDEAIQEPDAAVGTTRSRSRRLEEMVPRTKPGQGAEETCHPGV
jgi:hypothetical protein